jgi:hypothetical protein
MIIMMIFNISTSYSHKFSFHYFWRLFEDESDHRVRYLRALIRLDALIMLSLLGLGGILNGHTTCLRNVASFGSLLGLLLGLGFPLAWCLAFAHL